MATETAAPPIKTPPAGAPSATPASAGVINVVPPTVAGTHTETPPEESAKGKLFSDLAKKGRPTNSPREEKPASEKPVRSVEANPEETPPLKPGEKPAEVKPGEKPVEGKETKPGKPNPWKMLEEYKTKLTTAEKERDDARAAVLPEVDKKKYDERVTKSEARVKELEDHLRFVDYSKTEDFKKQYVEPYNKAWGEAMSELKEITVMDPSTQTERAVTAQDMLELVNMPLGKAREIADEVFGKFADDVMAHRKAIKTLFEKQQTALEDARKNGAEHLKNQQEESKRKDGEIRDQVTKLWTSENEAVLKDEKYGAYFAPKDGDEVWNQRLAKGFELVDRALAENPMDPKLNAEQRAAIIRRHAAVRNRAASWGALRATNEVLAEKNAALEKELSEYKGTEPDLNGGKPGEKGAVTTDAKTAMFGALNKLAKR